MQLADHRPVAQTQPRWIATPEYGLSSVPLLTMRVRKVRAVITSRWTLHELDSRFLQTAGNSRVAVPGQFGSAHPRNHREPRCSNRKVSQGTTRHATDHRDDHRRLPESRGLRGRRAAEIPDCSSYE